MYINIIGAFIELFSIYAKVISSDKTISHLRQFNRIKVNEPLIQIYCPPLLYLSLILFNCPFCRYSKAESVECDTLVLEKALQTPPLAPPSEINAELYGTHKKFRAAREEVILPVVLREVALLLDSVTFTRSSFQETS